MRTYNYFFFLFLFYLFQKAHFLRLTSQPLKLRGSTHPNRWILKKVKLVNYGPNPVAQKTWFRNIFPQNNKWFEY